MPDWSSTLSIDGDQEQSPAPADINITAQGDRRTLETLYLELRELAKQNGLKIEYRLTQTKPGDQADS
jgi:hypothetical protein